MTTPVEPLRILKKRLEDTLRPLGLHVRTFVTLVSDPGEPDRIQVLLSADRTDIGKTVQTAETDNAFAEIEKQFKADRTADQSEAARANLQALLNRHRNPPQN